MGDRGTLFCTSCGTVSVLEGDCPQCAKPLKRLGKIGTISNESKRSTQQLINFENVKASTISPTTSRRLILAANDLPNSEPNGINPIFKSTTFPPPNKSPDQQHSPRPAGQALQIPMLAHKLSLSQSPETPDKKPDIHPTEPPQTSYKNEDIPPPSLSQPPITPRSYFAAAVTRVSQVFSWKNKSGDQKSSDQKTAEHKSSEQQPPEIPISQMTGSSSLPNLVLAGAMCSEKNSPPSTGVRVLPLVAGKKTLRRRSLSGTANTGNLPSPLPQFASSTNLKKDSPKFSRRPTTTEIEADFVKIESSLDKSTIRSELSKVLNNSTQNKPESSSVESPTSRTTSSRSIKLPKLAINTSNLNSSTGESSPSFLFKNKSTLNISYGNMSKVPSKAIEPFYIPSGAQSLPTPAKYRPLPSPPVNTPTNPFPSLGQSPPIVSPRHTPPSRPLPSLPPIPDKKQDNSKENHPTILRRNTVHSDMHMVVKPPFAEQPRKELPSEWLSFAQNITGNGKAKFGNESPKTPENCEVTLLRPKPAELFFHPHIQAPPSQLSSDEMREKVAQELITTEYEYVNDLYTLVCAKLEMEKFIHKNELSSIFNNIDQIYKVNDALYRKLIGYLTSQVKRRTALTTTTDSGTLPETSFTPSADDKIYAISRTFLGLAHTLKIYVKYSLGHQRAFDKLKMLMETDEYGGMLKEVESMPGFKSSEMAGFLIKPVQRICRYPLLLKEILKSTPTGHTTEEELQEALQCMEETIQEINEAQRAIERELNLMRAQQDLRLLGMDIDVISPTRMLVLDGPMKLVPVIRKTGGSKMSKKPKQGHYFLFDDFFIFVMESKKKETPHIFIPADQTLVTDPGDNALEIVHSGQQVWMFVLPSYHDKVFLLQKLTQIIEDSLQEARNRNGGLDKSAKSTLNIATLTRSGKLKTKIKKPKKEGNMVTDLFGI